MDQETQVGFGGTPLHVLKQQGYTVDKPASFPCLDSSMLRHREVRGDSYSDWFQLPLPGCHVLASLDEGSGEETANGAPSPRDAGE